MKKLAAFLFLIFALFIEMTGANYQPFQFIEIEDAIGQTVGIHYGKSSVISMNDKLFIKNKKGKFKKAKDQGIDFSIIWAPNVFMVADIERDGKKEYLCLKDKEYNYYYILIDQSFTSELLPYIVSYSVLESDLDNFNDTCGYVLSPDFYYDLDDYYLKYLPVVWESVCLGKEIFDEPIYTIKIGDKSETGTLSYLEKVYNFASVNDRSSDLNKEIIDSIADYNLFPCQIETPVITKDEPSRAYAYYFDKSNDLVYVFNNFAPKCLATRSIKFDNPGDMNFLKSRGRRGIEIRKTTAMNKDSVECVAFYRNKQIQDSLRLDSLQRRAEEVQKFIDDLKKHKIFILNEEYSYGDYGQFGKETKFFNCFNKTIKYIHLTYTAYNGVGDIQRDDIGRTTSKGRCIGPVESGDIATYSFDDLFWDDRDLIDRVYLTTITFEFMDGTKTTYSGRKQIDTHRVGVLFK